VVGVQICLVFHTYNNLEPLLAQLSLPFVPSVNITRGSTAYGTSRSIYLIFHVKQGGKEKNHPSHYNSANDISTLLLRIWLRKAINWCAEGTLSTTNCPRISTSRIFLQSHDICHDNRGSILKDTDWLTGNDCVKYKNK
jgi:hypothetical protein